MRSADATDPPIEETPIAVPDADLTDLRRRLEATRWPETETVADWSQGAPLDRVRSLCDHWLHRYDWRRCEAMLNAWSPKATVIERGSDAVTMDQVHTRAGVSRATLYSNFTDKSDLLAAVIGAGAESFLTGVVDRQVSLEPVQQILIRFGDDLLAFIADVETMAFERLVAQAALSAPEHGPRFFAAGPGRARATLVAIIHAAQERGELQLGDASGRTTLRRPHQAATPRCRTDRETRFDHAPLPEISFRDGLECGRSPSPRSRTQRAS